MYFYLQYLHTSINASSYFATPSNFFILNRTRVTFNSSSKVAAFCYEKKDPTLQFQMSFQDSSSMTYSNHI